MKNQADFELWVKERYRITSLGKAFGLGYIGTATHKAMPSACADIQMLWEAYRAGIECERKKQLKQLTPSNSDVQS